MKRRPMSGNCPDCGKRLDIHSRPTDKEGNSVNVWVCNNPDCTNQEQYESFSNI
jgi:ssDNA-binding Zn-finger/Zn-ribbon topoisomerase 1